MRYALAVMSARWRNHRNEHAIAPLKCLSARFTGIVIGMYFDGALVKPVSITQYIQCTLLI